MSDDYNAFPDLEDACSAVLRDAAITGARVYSSIPGRATYPLLIVERLGGVPIEKHAIDQGRIQVSAYGNNKAEARDAADAARLALHRAAGTTVAEASCFITGVDDETGLTWLPDPVTMRDRYVFGVQVGARIA